jgi:hypothetical protein
MAAVVAGGDRRRSLEVIRDRVAAELALAEGRDVAVLAKELREVIRELDSLPGVGMETPLDRIAGSVSDDLAKRRAARVADAAGS